MAASTPRAECPPGSLEFEARRRRDGGVFSCGRKLHSDTQPARTRLRTVPKSVIFYWRLLISVIDCKPALLSRIVKTFGTLRNEQRKRPSRPVTRQLRDRAHWSTPSLFRSTSTVFYTLAQNFTVTRRCIAVIPFVLYRFRRSAAPRPEHLPRVPPPLASNVASNHPNRGALHWTGRLRDLHSLSVIITTCSPHLFPGGGGGVGVGGGEKGVGGWCRGGGGKNGGEKKGGFANAISLALSRLIAVSCSGFNGDVEVAHCVLRSRDRFHPSSAGRSIASSDKRPLRARAHRARLIRLSSFVLLPPLTLVFGNIASSSRRPRRQAHPYLSAVT